MVSETHYCQMKAVVLEVKQLFQSRRYIQCASVCERFLSGFPDEILHPVHRVYLHFYFALVHDTMARETTLKHRASGLELAEQHYRAAIDVLTPSEPYNLDDILSPAFSTSGYSSDNGHRRSYRHSFRSAACSTTSDEEDGTWDHIHSSYDTKTSRTDSFLTVKSRPPPIMPINAARAYHEDRFSVEMFALLSMLHTHLEGVKQLKSDLPQACGWSARSRSSPWSSRPASRDSSTCNENETDQLRSTRSNVRFRPRFDPTSIRQLCNEALAEL